MSDSINEQRCEHGQTRPHRGINLGFNEPRIDCPGPSVVTPLGQDERTPDELVELASEASLRIDALNAQTRATLNGDRCTHDSSSGDEGPVSDLVGPVVRWRCDGCGDVWYDDQALTSLRAEIITRSRSVPAAPSVSTDHTDERSEHEQRAFKHYDDVGDGGATYFQFHGWVLTCYSCGWDVRGETKEQALHHMQEHYDRVTSGTEFRVKVRRG